MWWNVQAMVEEVQHTGQPIRAPRTAVESAHTYRAAATTAATSAQTAVRAPSILLGLIATSPAQSPARYAPLAINIIA